MSLSVISGPFNSGRAGEVLRRFRAAAAADPVLVVPTREDTESFERELCAGPDGEAGASVGGAVLTFERLFDEVARATGAATPRPLSAAQRLQLVREAVRRVPLRALGRSAQRAGFVPATEELIGELQAAAIDPATLAEAVGKRGAGATERELAALYSAYAELCAELGMTDPHGLAAAATVALRRQPGAWGRRPVLLYGFDDLTREQLELVRSLAAACEVTVAVTFEDRAALVARSRLHGELVDGLGGRVTDTFESQPGYTASATLHHLERHLFEAGAPRVPPGEGLELLEAAGARGEAEQIAGRIARLLAAGVAPDEIAVVLRNPDSQASLFEQVMEGLGIPLAVEARVPLASTATGRGLLALLRAFSKRGTADDVLAFLRAPGRARPADADWLERAIRRGRLRSTAEALAEWERLGGRRLWELEALAEAASEAERLRALARIAAEIAEWPLRRSAPLPGRARRLELRAAALAHAALEELAELGGLAPGPADAQAALEGLAVPLWTGPVEGRVRIVSPYRVRAGRVAHLFVASLQDGEFPGADGGDPLLGEQRRETLGLPARRPPLDEERYLFHACVSRPTERLYLSFRASDEDGRAALPSPFLDDVRDLLAPAPPAQGPDPVAESLTRRRGLDAVTFAPVEAPTVGELRRGLAALGPAAGRAALESLRLPGGTADEALAAAAEARERGEALPGPLRVPGVIEELAARRLFGASTIEDYLVCPYRWFVRHELAPESLDPRPDPLVQGGIVHAALERLYSERPGGTPVPRPETVAAWRSRAAELIVELAGERGIEADRGAGARVSVARMVALTERFLEREALCESPLSPDPALLEAAFGEGEGNARPPLDLGEFQLHGKVDRVDVSAGPRRAALVGDYKLSREVPKRASLEREGRVQLQLYALAIRELWGLEPVGAVYRPLGAPGGKASRPRGFLIAGERDGLLAGVEYVSRDFASAEEVDELLRAARERAIATVRRMRSGDVRREPLGGSCPTYCTFQPICRRERAAGLDPGEEEDSSG